MATTDIVSNLSQVSQVTNPASKALADRTKLADDFDDFLLMLTTQLKNQDPTEPLDTNQFTQQLVMFASVEQQVATNENMETLVNVMSGQGVDSAVNYIGKMVEAKGDGGFLQDGSAPFIYALDRSAEKVNIVVTDRLGKPVFSGTGTGFGGKNLVTWNGENSFTGEKMPEGAYRIQVNATDVNGQEVGVTTATIGRVSAAEVGEDGIVKLTVGTLQIPVTDVTAIREMPDMETADSN